MEGGGWSGFWVSYMVNVTIYGFRCRIWLMVPFMVYAIMVPFMTSSPSQAWTAHVTCMLSLCMEFSSRVGEYDPLSIVGG